MNRKSRRSGDSPSRLSSASLGSLGSLALLGGGMLTIGLSAGCEFQTDLKETFANVYPTRTDLVASGQVKGQAVSGPGVVVSLPTVFRENDDLLISGTVTRQTGYDAPVPGFLDVQVLGPDGKQIDESLLHWDPEQIPTAATRSARYHARILGYPPAGSTVRVAYVDKITDLESFNGPTIGSGGAAAGGGRARSGGGGMAHGGHR